MNTNIMNNIKFQPHILLNNDEKLFTDFMHAVENTIKNNIFNYNFNINLHFNNNIIYHSKKLGTIKQYLA
jgi:hypothetical protein